jgi:isopentenyl phosphate kinase
MRRSLVARTFALCFAAWFAISLMEPAALHACPMHGAGAFGHAHVASTHAGAHGEAEHAASMHSAAAPADAPAQSHTGNFCTCLGSCTASNAAAVLPVMRASIGSVETYAVARVPHAVRAHIVTAPPFFLPYANGPPAHAIIA